MSVERSAESRRCRACGAHVKARDHYCWLCGEALQVGARTASPAEPAGAVAPVGYSAPPRSNVGFVGGCLMGVVLVPVCAFIALFVICKGSQVSQESHGGSTVPPPEFLEYNRKK